MLEIRIFLTSPSPWKCQNFASNWTVSNTNLGKIYKHNQSFKRPNSILTGLNVAHWQGTPNWFLEEWLRCQITAYWVIKVGFWVSLHMNTDNQSALLQFTAQTQWNYNPKQTVCTPLVFATLFPTFLLHPVQTRNVSSSPLHIHICLCCLGTDLWRKFCCWL